MARQRDDRADTHRRPPRRPPLVGEFLAEHQRERRISHVVQTKRGVDALEFWNDGVEGNGLQVSADARFLRAHVLELPIHQDLTDAHLDYIAQQISLVNRGMAA